MGITYGGKKGTRRVKAKKQQKQSNFQNPFGDAFKELTKTVKISRIKTDEAMLILNFEKNEIPTVDEINERFTTFYNMNDSTEQGSVYLQSKIKNSREQLLAEFHDVFLKRSDDRLELTVVQEERLQKLQKVFKEHIGKDKGLSYDAFNKYYNEVQESVGMEKLSDDLILKMAIEVDKDKSEQIEYDQFKEFLLETLRSEGNDKTEPQTETQEEKKESPKDENSKKD